MRQRTIYILNGNKKHWSMLVILKALLMTLILGLCVACTQTTGVKNTTSDKLDQITQFATEVINRDIANYELNPAVEIIDSKITRLEIVDSLDSLADKTIYVYALEYRLLPKDLSKVVLAGGMSVDENGWLKETSSMGSPLLVLQNNNEKVELIGILLTGGVQEEGGIEEAIKGLLKRN